MHFTIWFVTLYQFRAGKKGFSFSLLYKSWQSYSIPILYFPSVWCVFNVPIANMEACVNRLFSPLPFKRQHVTHTRGVVRLGRRRASSFLTGSHSVAHSLLFFLCFFAWYSTPPYWSLGLQLAKLVDVNISIYYPVHETNDLLERDFSKPAVS